MSNESGLKINKTNSNLIIYNMENQPSKIEEIEISNTTKYLGLIV